MSMKGCSFQIVANRRSSCGILDSRKTRAGGPARLHSQNLLVHELFVFFRAAGESEGIRHVRFALGDTGDDVGAADPMGFGEIGLRPAWRMVGMGVVKADNVET